MLRAWALLAKLQALVRALVKSRCQPWKFNVGRSRTGRMQLNADSPNCISSCRGTVNSPHSANCIRQSNQATFSKPTHVLRTPSKLFGNDKTIKHRQSFWQNVASIHKNEKLETIKWNVIVENKELQSCGKYWSYFFCYAQIVDFCRHRCGTKFSTEGSPGSFSKTISCVLVWNDKNLWCQR